jgi:hypothetical protein
VNDKVIAFLAAVAPIGALADVDEVGRGLCGSEKHLLAAGWADRLTGRRGSWIGLVSVRHGERHRLNLPKPNSTKSAA